MKYVIDEIINKLTKEEFREFKYFVQRRDKEKESEDIKLVDRIRKRSTEKTFTNAERKTRNRLKKSFEQFAELENIRLNEKSKISNLIEVADYLFNKNLYEQALHYLANAEKIAATLDEYTLLDEIYRTQISYSYAIYASDKLSVNIPELLNKWQNNLYMVKVESNANAAFTELFYSLKEILFKKLHFETDDLLMSILKKYELSDQYYTNVKIYSRVVNMVGLALREAGAYEKLKLYSIHSYNHLLEKKMIEKVTPNSMTDIFRSICLAAQASRDYETLALYVDKFKKYAAKYKHHEDQFDYTYYLTCIYDMELHLHTNKLSKANDIIQSLYKKYESETTVRIYTLLRINFLIVSFNSKNYEKCVKILNELLHDTSKVLETGGVMLLLFVEIFRIIVYYEYDDERDYTHYLLKNLKRKHAQLLADKGSVRERTFLKIFEKTINDPSYISSKKFISDCNKFMELKADGTVHKQPISISSWLKSKLSHKSYYACYLELV